jgi:transcription elongation regulator 1
LKKKRIEKPSELQHHQQSKTKEKEPEMSEEEKAKQKSKPISSTPVPGTPWCVVWTRDKRVFFFNPSEKVSLWERPAMLLGRVDVDKMLRECPAGGATSSDSTPASSAVSSNNTANGSAKKKINETSAVEQQPPVKKVEFCD